MSSVVISGDSSGTVTLTVPSAAGTNTATLPAATGTVMVSGNMPAFSAYQSAAQTLTSGAFSKLTVNTEEFDTANCYDSTTNYRFTPNVAGYYQVNANYNTGNSGVTLAVIYKNGSAYKYGPNSTGSNPNGAIVSCLVYMNGTTDYIEFYGYTNVPAGAGVINNSQNTWFQAAMVRSA